MTAEFTVETDQALGVPLVPNGALRFEPTPAVLAAFGASMPPSTAAGTTPAPAVRASRVSTPTRVRADSRATIDDELGPVPRPVTSGRVWVLDGATLKAIPIRLGLTDGIQTQVVSGDIHPGEALVTAVDLPGSRR